MDKLWHIQRVNYLEHKNLMEILEEGYEPFAVTEDNDGFAYVYLKKQYNAPYKGK